VLATMTGGAANARLLAYPYSNQSSYFDSSWPSFSSDGKVVIFSSDMLGSGRYDLFLATLPVKP
jgi:Tol biopolymer transport system component